VRLKEKVAVITGGGNGIGRAICQAFVDEGAAVVVADIDTKAANRVASDIGRYGGFAIPVKMDVTNAVDVNACLAQTIRDLERFTSWSTCRC